MTKSKLTALVLAAMFAAALSGCGSKGTSPSTGSPAGTRAPTATTAAPASGGGGGGGGGY